MKYPSRMTSLTSGAQDLVHMLKRRPKCKELQYLNSALAEGKHVLDTHFHFCFDFLRILPIILSPGASHKQNRSAEHEDHDDDEHTQAGIELQDVSASEWAVDVFYAVSRHDVLSYASVSICRSHQLYCKHRQKNPTLFFTILPLTAFCLFHFLGFRNFAFLCVGVGSRAYLNLGSSLPAVKIQK